MAGRGPKHKVSSRESAERARLYTARAQWNARGIHRRVRDNAIAVVAGGLLVVGVFVSQAVHASVTAPEPEPTVVTDPEPTPEDTAPATPAPTPESTAPAPTE